MYEGKCASAWLKRPLFPAESGFGISATRVSGESLMRVIMFESWSGIFHRKGNELPALNWQRMIITPDSFLLILCSASLFKTRFRFFFEMSIELAKELIPQIVCE